MSNLAFPRVESFPRAGSSAEILQFLLQYAVLAPSSHNTQPWNWKIIGDEVALFADRSRLMPAIDPKGRELIMSCGAALEHLVVAGRAFGYATLVRPFPDENEPDCLAQIRLAGQREVGEEEIALFAAILNRHTNRGWFKKQELPTELLDFLKEEAAAEGAWLHLLTEESERGMVAELIALADDIQVQDPKARADWADWMASNTGERRDGIPGYAMGIGDSFSRIAPFLTRLFGPGIEHGDQDWMLAGSAPVLAVLGTHDDQPTHWLAAGRALARVLLRATSQGVAASFFSQPIQVEPFLHRLRHILNRAGSPQLIFRLGYASDEARPTPRRAVDEVAQVEE